MIKRFALVLALLTSACVSVPRPPVVTPAVSPFATVACVIQDEEGHGVVNATCRVTDASASTFSGVTNAEGYVAFDGVRVGKVHIEALALNYKEYSSSPDDYTIAGNVNARITLELAHVDPLSISRAKLVAFRGALFTVAANCDLPMFLPSGERVPVVPFAPVWGTPEQRRCTYDRWRERGYTHGVVGPFIDPGYHGETPSVDFRSNPDAALDQLQEAWDQGFYPIVVIVPDHWGAAEGWGDHIWTVEELKALEPIYRSPRFQKLARIVMLCWECQNGDVYGWANTTYLAYGRWLADVFPNAIPILHTIADIEVPVGQGDELNTANCHGLGPEKCLSSGQAWTRVAEAFGATADRPLVWFEQSSALFRPDHLADNGHTDADNWLHLLWDASNPGSLTRRFRDGSNGYPTSMFAIPAEYLSYEVWNGRASEAQARQAGDRAIGVGGLGYMDGGTVDVPVTVH